ncbi:MAG: TonB-dependent siderophore receptor [Proteobacteria bacterium]|nr:MAG: TonB-dependent siderophore receptor [Pseudomonadota bacterium]
MRSQTAAVEPPPAIPLPDGVLLNGGPAPVATTAGPVSGYRALTAISATRTNTPIERIPQTVAVIPRSLIDDQTPLTQSEVLRNIAATTGVPANFLYGVNYKVRGFDADRLIDGLPNYIDAGDFSSLVNVERIEVVKGPGGLLFQSGVGITGGVINTISKLPVPNPAYQAGLIAGGYGLWNPWIDFNQPLGNGALFRFTGELEKTRDYIDVIDNRRYSLNPTLTFTDNDGSSLTVQGRISRRDVPNYVGLPGTGTIDQSLFSLRRDLFVGPADLPKSLSENSGVTARFDHTFNSIWSFNVSARYSETRQLELAQSYLHNVPDFGTSFAMFNLASPWTAREFSANPNAIAKFAIGPTTNTLLLAADYDRVTDDVSIWSSLAGITNFANPSPVFPQFTDPMGAGTPLFNASDINVNSGLTAQLQTTVWERLHLLSGVRRAYVDFLGSHPFGGGEYHIEQSKLLPRFGAALDLVPGVTPFAGYSEGLRTVRFFAGRSTPKPEEAKQTEAGVKLVLPYGFAATLAVFDITRRNVVSTDPANPFLQVQTGEERSRGFDMTGTWQPLPGLSMWASYAHVDARITQDIFFPVGNRLERVPLDSGRFWASYKVPQGLFRNVTIGAGLYAASNQAIGLDNHFFVPGYLIFDAKLGYETQAWSFAVVGKNLANCHYFIPYPYALGRVAPGEPLTVLAVATLRQ